MPPEPSENLRLRKYRKGGRYTDEERRIIEPYKVSFRSQQSKAGRLQILKTDILPAMFNYWAAIDKAPVDQEESRLRAKVNSQACEGCTIDHIARN
jgi:hypothetical protein